MAGKRVGAIGGPRSTRRARSYQRKKRSRPYGGSGPRCQGTAIAQPLIRFRRTSNSLFVTFVSFVVAPTESGGQRPEWRTRDRKRCGARKRAGCAATVCQGWGRAGRPVPTVLITLGRQRVRRLCPETGWLRGERLLRVGTGLPLFQLLCLSQRIVWHHKRTRPRVAHAANGSRAFFGRQFGFVQLTDLIANQAEQLRFVRRSR